LNPTLTDQILEEIYTGYHEAGSDEAVVAMVSEWFSHPDGAYQKALQWLEQGGGLAAKQVAEVGCGPGRFLHECRLRGAHVTGVDISPGAVRMAKNFFDLELISKPIEQALKDNDLQAGAFDVVFAFEIIEHVHKPQEFIHSLARLLSPGGRLFVSTPNFHLFKLMGSAAEVVSKWPEHLHFFEPDTLRQCLERGGLTDVRIISASQKSPSERHKEVLARKPAVNALWQRLRRVPAVCALKDVLFKAVDGREERNGETSYSGLSLLGYAVKPAS
jgi:2-polyprenyl-6-hydroxyphenyl methylase/3-demethylubiquinone-9 3-methyltransferase